MDETVKLGNEIIKNQWIQFYGTVAVLVLMAATTLASRLQGEYLPDDTSGYEWGTFILFVLVLGIAWPLMMGKYDFETGRIGVWLGKAGSAWEVSDVRHYKKWMLFIYDAGATLPIWFLFGHAVYRTWQMGFTGTAVSSAILFLCSTGLFVYAPMVHRELVK